MNDSSKQTASVCDVFGLQIAVAILLGTLLVTNAVQSYFVFSQHTQLVTASKQLLRDDVRKQLGDAQLVGRSLEALAHELVVLAPTNANAKRILEEFHIQAPAAAPAAAAAARPAR
jgi:hypothetical protein